MADGARGPALADGAAGRDGLGAGVTRVAAVAVALAGGDAWGEAAGAAHAESMATNIIAMGARPTPVPPLVIGSRPLA